MNTPHQLLTDDAPDHIVEAAAETARKVAFESLNAWHGLPLVWTSSRAGLYDFLRIPSPVLSQATLEAIQAAREAADTPDADALQDRANALFMRETGGSTGHVRNAQIILWLAAHQPKDWRSLAHDRGRLLEVIDEWTDENVAPGELQELAEVTNQLLTEADKTRAIVRPKNTSSDEEGN
jgi:acyl-CoA synthetase (AMP-forming)/AMP-acid ligase II